MKKTQNEAVSETKIQNAIRTAISNEVVNFRINVGSGKTASGSYLSTGVPTGFSDIFGVRKRDGKAVFIEVKTPIGRIRPTQKNFIEQMRTNNAIAGICRSVEDALKLISED